MLSLIFRPSRVSIDTLELDATISENHSSTSQVTSHEIEDGADITDHVRANQDSLTIEGMVSDTPIRWLALASPGRAISAYQQLREIASSGKPVTLVTKLRSYKNMVLTSLSVPRAASSGDAVNFTATFTQIRFASVTRSSGGKKEGGYQAAKPASQPVANEAVSALGRTQIL